MLTILRHCDEFQLLCCSRVVPSVIVQNKSYENIWLVQNIVEFDGCLTMNTPSSHDFDRESMNITGMMDAHRRAKPLEAIDRA
jgi:hypothetical protein